MKTYVLFFFVGLSHFAFSQISENAPDQYPSTMIYSHPEEYSAFTDLIRFNGYFYCSFRIGSSHVGGQDGKVRILRSRDGEKWKSVVILEKEGVDLRDPKLSIDPQGRLMVIIGGSVYEGNTLLDRNPHVSFSDKKGKKFSKPMAIDIPDNTDEMQSWIWRVIWKDGIGYGIDYQTQKDEVWDLYLTQSRDGQRFEKVSQLPVDGLPNEATIGFGKNDEMYVLIRREGGDKKGLLARSNPPYQSWGYSKLDFQLGGPNFLFLNDSELVIGTRNYNGPRTTHLKITNLKGEVRKTIELPSGGDNSYPGMVLHDGFLWVSYYSSHEGQSSIYLSKIPLNEL